MSPNWKLPRDGRDSDEDALELAYLRSLSTQERFEMMFRKSREMAEMLLRNGHRRPVEISKRT